MNNDEAMALLVTTRTAINDAINGLVRYKQEADNWKAAVKTSQMAAIISSASDAGADISTWDGTKA
jgi:hypothetical protein